MDQELTDYFDCLEKNLREKKDRSEELDELFQLSFLGDDETKEKVSWCVAKMGQNKVPDMRILNILASMYESENDQIRENVAWGIGEIAGAEIGDDRSVAIITKLMCDPEKNVRGTAVWAAGRLKHKLGIDDERMTEIAKDLINDPSPLVSKSAEFYFE